MRQALEIDVNHILLLRTWRVLVIRRNDGLNSKPAQSAQPLKLTTED